MRHHSRTTPPSPNDRTVRLSKINPHKRSRLTGYNQRRRAFISGPRIIRALNASDEPCAPARWARFSYALVGAAIELRSARQWAPKAKPAGDGQIGIEEVR